MRSVLVIFVMALSGCRCSPPTPQPVTMRVINTTKSPIYVDATNGKLGLTVQRDVSGTLFGFDDLACECRFCSNSCNATACSCPDAGMPRVQKIEPGGKAERTWNGVIQTAGFSNCGTDACLDQINAPLNEPFTLELCFNVQRPVGVRFDDAGVGEGTVANLTATCTTRQFAPQDREVEIGPVRGSSCMGHADCKGQDELCFDGACTTSCPANDFPPLGSEWLLLVASIDNMGFFEQGARGTGGKQFTGTGTLTAAIYQSGSLLLTFSRMGPIPNEMLTGRVQIKLPAGVGVPITPGGRVKVLVTDDGEDVPSRAISIRDAVTDQLLFVADMAQGARGFTPTELAPLSIVDSTSPVGCVQDSCGRRLYFPVSVSLGSTAVEALPGAEVEVATGAHFLNVSSGAYRTSPCEITDQRPWLFWRE